MKVHDFHQSGYHGAADDQWSAAVAGGTERADLGAFTEATDQAPSPRGWAQWHGGNECTILWDWAAWRRMVACLPTPLTTKSWYLGDKKVTGHERHGVTATWVMLEHRLTGRTLLRGAFHVPSSIQGGAGWSKKAADRDNVAAAKDVLANLAPTIITLQDLLRPDETTISADWNVHLGLPEWRDRIDAHLVGTGIQLAPPTFATHGTDRSIDALASTMGLARDADGDPRPVRALPRVKEFDHRGLIAGLTTT